MKMTEPTSSPNPFENLSCPRCSNLMPPEAEFCGVCGEPLQNKKVEERGVGAQVDVEDVEDQDDDVTVRLPLLSRTHAKLVQSYQTLKKNGLPAQTDKNGSSPQSGDVSAITSVVDTRPASAETPEFALVSSDTSPVPATGGNPWGWLPVLSVTGAVGVLLVAIAAEAGRVSSQWADPLFWLGLLVLFVPVVVRIISPKPTRRERVALIVMLNSLLSLFRVLEQPLSFAFNDEFAQWRTVQDIIASGHLFQRNPILTVGPFYPGLQIVTDALSSLTGLSIFVSGMLVLAVAELLLALALYLFYEYLSSSAQVAAIASLLYMAKPTFFGDTLFHYEDLAMPLSIFVLFVVAWRGYMPKGKRRGLTLATALGIGAVAITHHLASYMLVMFLLLWTAAFLFLKALAPFRRKRGKEVQASPAGAALLGLVLVGAWSAYTAERVINYLLPIIQTTINQIIQIVTGAARVRQAFGNSTGYVEPLWEHLISFASIGLISLGLPFGLYQIWRRYRNNAAVLALAVGSLAYPAILAMRLTNAGVNLGGRAQPYVFGAVAFVLALGIRHFWLSRPRNWRYSTPLTGAMAIVFIGGWVIGTSPSWNRLPGPYLPYADQRSIQLESVSAAQWAGEHLEPGQRVIGDHVNLLLMGTYGGAWTVSSSSEQIVVTPVFTEPYLNAYVIQILRQGRVQYVVVDHRLEIPGVGWYDGVGVPVSNNPNDPGALAKFEGVPDVDRVYDNGDIVIYNVEAITNGALIPPTLPPGSPCMPASSSSPPGSYPKMARLYNGIIYSVHTGFTTEITLSGIRQQQGNICGHFSRISVNLPFQGTIGANGQVRFSFIGSKRTFYFEGFLQPDGTLEGSYCGVVAGSSGCNDYGLWSVTPAQSG